MHYSMNFLPLMGILAGMVNGHDVYAEFLFVVL